MFISIALGEISLFISINLLSIFFLKKITNYLGLIDYSRNKIHSLDTPKYGFQFFLIIFVNCLIILNFNLKLDSLIILFYLFSFLIIGFGSTTVQWEFGIILK